MSPRELGAPLVREAPLLRDDTPVEEAVRALLDADLPALPVVNGAGKLLGLFGEREFIEALFPGYLKELGYAGFVPRSIESVIEKRQTCRLEPVSKHLNREHVEVDAEFSDVGLAEAFIHHRVLVVPVVDRGRVVGVVSRSDFFAAMGELFLDR